MSDMTTTDTSPEALERLANFACFMVNNASVCGDAGLGSIMRKYEEVLLAIAAEKRAGPDGGWNHDMSAAPRDGTPIIAISLYGDISVVRFGGEEKKYGAWECLADGNHAIESQCDFGTEYVDITPTAWRHLPAPPAKQDQTK